MKSLMPREREEDGAHWIKENVSMKMMNANGRWRRRRWALWATGSAMVTVEGLVLLKGFFSRRF